VEDAARELGIPTKTLRAVEWDRGDLVGGFGEVDRIERAYADFLGLMLAPPAVEVPAAPSPSPTAAPSPSRRAVPATSLPLLASLPLPIVIVLVAVLGETPLLILMLGLTLLSAVLLAGALVPTGILARAHVPATTFARYRQPLALSAIGILAPVAAAAVLTALV
jgi:hypothetical protein